MVLCFPSDNVQHELQHSSLINIIPRKNKQKGGNLRTTVSLRTTFCAYSQPNIDLLRLLSVPAPSTLALGTQFFFFFGGITRAKIDSSESRQGFTDSHGGEYLI